MWKHGWTDRKTDKQTDMANLIVAFHNFANALKNNFFYVSMTTPHFSPTPSDVSIYPAPRSKSVLKADDFSGSQEISHILWSPKLIRYTVLTRVSHYSLF